MGGIKNSAAGKKGILFTVSVMLLGISLLSFSFFLAEQSAKARHTAVALLEIDGTKAVYSNIERELGGIISPSVNISVENWTMQISETLPLDAQMPTDLDRFAQFEKNYSDLNVSMNLTSLKAGSFRVQPAGVAITNTAGSFRITPQNTSGSAGQLQTYDITATYPVGSMDSAAWQSVSNASGNGSLAVRVRLQDDSGTVLFDSYQTLDKYRTSMLNITQAGATVSTMQFSSPAALQLDYTGNMGLKASVGFSNAVYVETDDMISVKSAVNITGKPRIA